MAWRSNPLDEHRHGSKCLSDTSCRLNVPHTLIFISGQTAGAERLGLLMVNSDNMSKTFLVQLFHRWGNQPDAQRRHASVCAVVRLKRERRDAPRHARSDRSNNTMNSDSVPQTFRITL